MLNKKHSYKKIVEIFKVNEIMVIAPAKTLTSILFCYLTLISNKILFK